MGWAERFAEGKKSHARYRALAGRTRALTFGAILAGAGGFGLYSDTTHQINGRPATATLLEHVKECTVEYQRIGEEKRQEKWPCERAEEFQQRIGKDRVKLSRDFIARVRFPLENGRTYEASVDEGKLDSYKLSIGATLPVFYAPGDPADVRAEMSWDRLKIQLGLLAAGLVFLALAFGNPITALVAWTFRGRTGEVVEPASPEHFAPTATRASEPKEGNRMPRRPLASANTHARTAGSGRASFGMRK